MNRPSVPPVTVQFACRYELALSAGEGGGRFHFVIGWFSPEPDEQHGARDNEQNADPILEPGGPDIGAQNLIEIAVDAVADHYQCNHFAVATAKREIRDQEQKQQKHAD